MSDVTRLLAQIDSGDPQAAEQLLPLVYGELRKLAAAKLAHEKPGLTLDATALVHEAYLRLVGRGVRSQESGVRGQRAEVRSRRSEVRNRLTDLRPPISEQLPLASSPEPPAPPAFDHRGHFFAAAAEAMRRILVERARHKGRAKHGGGLVRKDLETLDIAAPEVADDLLALDEALTRLAATDEQASRLVSLRYFAGLSLPQVAQPLDISPRTADRLWAYARAFLHAEIYEK